VVPATRAGLKVGDRLAQCTLRGNVEAGEQLAMITLVGLKPKDAGQHLSCARLTDGAAVLGVPGPVLASLGGLDLPEEEARIDADAVLVGDDLVYASGVRQLTCGPTLLAANRPVDLCWTPRDGRLALFCAEPTALAIAATRGNDLREGDHPLLVTRIADGLIWTRIDRGDHAITGATMPVETAEKLRATLEALRAAGSREAPTPPDEPLPADLPALQAVATSQVEGVVTRILPGPDRDGMAGVYVTTDADRAYPLTVDGKLGEAIQAPAKIMSPAYWPEPGLLLLGCADDRVYAFDHAGTNRWTFQSEMHPDVYATGKTYWFKKDLPGIYGLKTGRLDGEASRAFVGSACTVEVLDEAGKLVKRVPLYWGSCAVMGILPNPDGTRKLVVAKAPNLSNDLSTIHGADWSTGRFGVHPPFQLSQSTLNILVDDLDRDGQPEVICDTNGSMNNVRVYDSAGKTRWSAEFGPPAAGSVTIGISVPRPTMRGLVVVDFQGEGEKHVVTATAEGLVTAFRADGTQAWARYLPSAPWCLARLPRDGGDLLAVGCEDGTLLLVDAAGKPVAKAQLKGAVRQLCAVERDGGPVLIAGTDQGVVAILRP